MLFPPRAACRERRPPRRLGRVAHTRARGRRSSSHARAPPRRAAQPGPCVVPARCPSGRGIVPNRDAVVRLSGAPAFMTGPRRCGSPALRSRGRPTSAATWPALAQRPTSSRVATTTAAVPGPTPGTVQSRRAAACRATPRASLRLRGGQRLGEGPQQREQRCDQALLRRGTEGCRPRRSPSCGRRATRREAPGSLGTVPGSLAESDHTGLTPPPTAPSAGRDAARTAGLDLGHAGGLTLPARDRRR
jgi:hypothetical protein